MKTCLLLILIVCSSVLRADTVHFYTDDEGTSQRWHGKVLKITENEVIVEFDDRKQRVTRSIHLSRVLSIYFDDHLIHRFPIRLRRVIANPIPGNLHRPRKIYLSAAAMHSFEVDYPELRLYGQSLLSGNITSLDRQTGKMLLKLRTKDGEYRNADLSRHMHYIRAWVR